MISFYPGPSQIYPQVKSFMMEACEQGILSVNHRSPEFISLCQKVVENLRVKLNVPNDYQVFFTSSATECWEIISQSVVRNTSCHLYNGAFGEKWMEYAGKIKNCTGNKFGLNEVLVPAKYNDVDTVCITSNETSNGTKVSNKIIREIKFLNPDKVVAVDATSSMAGVVLDFKSADIWFASVQKCFGLPAGLAVMICSPFALDRARELADKKHYNSMVFLADKMKDFQTTYTPNVLGIYLLKRVLDELENIATVDVQVKTRANDWFEFLKGNGFENLVENESVRSETVVCIKSDEKSIGHYKTKAKESGIILGNGYGDWAKTTFRIANFPAISDSQISQLKNLLTEIK